MRIADTVSNTVMNISLVQFHRSLFAMLHPCNNGDHETPNVCWSAVEHATTASGERPSLTRRLRVTTLPDPACQRWRPTSLRDRGAPWMYGTNRAQHDSCIQSRHDDVLASQIVSPQKCRTRARRSQTRTASGDRARKSSFVWQAHQSVDASPAGRGLL